MEGLSARAALLLYGGAVYISARWFAQLILRALR
jgi:hypothetical protein